MTTLTVQIPDSETSRFKEVLKQINGVIIKPATQNKTSKVLKDIETGLKQVKAYQEGKGKMYTLSEVLNGK